MRPVAAGYPDYHTHTLRCGHATGAAADYVDAALRFRLSGIGISDHLPLADHPDPSVCMPEEDLADYVDEVCDLKARYPGYVLLGIEADYLPGRAADIRAVLESYPFDYVIGSVHFLDGWGFDNEANIARFAERAIDEIYVQYYELVGEAAESRLFTIMGHLDLVKKFGHRPEGGLAAEVQQLVGRLARSSVILELNTAGLRKPVGEIYPELRLLATARARGIPITFGSDAHTPRDVGFRFSEAASLARTAGYEAWAQLVERPGLRASMRLRPL